MSEFVFPEVIPAHIDKAVPLKKNEIHLYTVSIPELKGRLKSLSSCLSKEEQARASRFLNPEHGDNHRCVRGLLRQLLSRYLVTEPSSIRFEYADHGKPYLINSPDLHFNLSHSRDMASVTVYREAEIGVDIEYMRPQKNLAGMIRHVASEREQIELNALDETDVYDAFYRLWTRKEAFIKAVGRGLGMGLRSIHIGTQASDFPLAVTYKNKQQKKCLISDIKAPENYRQAICVYQP